MVNYISCENTSAAQPNYNLYIRITNTLIYNLFWFIILVYNWSFENERNL